ncbi:Splicing factor 3B subunit 1 [Mycena kentingensis (nom. inval.)]|nr:Splicing factor 3B subunit 1 [Mycena kentingensis (nom. inval.)]
MPANDHSSNSYTTPKDALDELRDADEQVFDTADTSDHVQSQRFARAEFLALAKDEEYPTAMRLALEAQPNTRDTLLRKRRWDGGATTDGVQPNKRRSRWDVAPSELEPIFMQPAGHAAQAPLSATELDILLPSVGFTVFVPHESHLDPASSGFVIHERSSFTIQDAHVEYEPPSHLGNLAFFRPEDAHFFAAVLGEDDDESMLTVEALKERQVLRLLLKIKNGTPPVRKAALRQITSKAREFGAAPLLDKIIPLLMERSIGDQERHLLVKVVDRILFQLDDLVRPFVHKILVVIQPLLIDEDFYARAEAREIVSNLAKAAGLAHMISTMRPDIDHADEFVRSTTARAFAIVATALGIPAVVPFVKAVCRSRKSWQARYTGLRIVQQIAIMAGAGVLPHLTPLVECVAIALADEQQKVRTMAALAVAALAEAAAPFGIESFGDVVQPLWAGIRVHRGKGLAAFLKATGAIVPLMDPEYAALFTKPAMQVLMREFKTTDEEMKKIVLKVLRQCIEAEGVEKDDICDEVVPQFFAVFWTRRTALDRRVYRQVVDTAVVLGKTTGTGVIVARIVEGLKDDSEPFRQMVLETIAAVVRNVGVLDLDNRTELQLVDGALCAFQEQTTEDKGLLDAFGTIVNTLGARIQPYLLQIVSTVLWRLNNKSAKVRQQAADLTTQLSVAIKQCGEEQMLAKLGLVLFEQLGEEYPDTLASILVALGAVNSVSGTNAFAKDLVSRLVPILRNRHKKVQEAAIRLIGRFADRDAELVSAREWMRIAFELLNLLNAHNKNIRPRSTTVLLTNLRVQERQSRVCSAIAIAVIPETCGPFTCIPAILNEYRSAELSVRTGCLKALAFVFEYIGPQAVVYCNFVVALLEDALMERDAVHRQTASTIVKHLALGVAGSGCEDQMMHLMNLVWPNCFETSPHLIGSVLGALEAMRIVLGPGVVLCYVLQGLFHASRKVREIYWTIYNTLYLGTADALVAFYPDLGRGMASGYVNIRRDVDDKFYRYRMPILLTKIEGKGNGIKTVLPNMADVARALSRPPSYTTKFFGCELGAQTTCDEKNERYIVNGAHDATRLRELLDGFIEKFVLCKSCKNPETELIILKVGRNEDIIRDCKACGERTDVEMKHKLVTFILKNPPIKARKGKKAAQNGDAAAGVGGGAGPSAGDASPDGADGEEGDGNPDSDDELTKKIKAEAAELTEETALAKEDWSADTSPEAVKARMKALEGGLAGASIDDDGSDDDANSPYTQFGNWIMDAPELDDPKALNLAIFKKAEELGIEKKHKTVLILTTIFTEDVMTELSDFAPLLQKMVTSEKHQKALLGGIERLVGLAFPDLLPQVPKILMELYQADVLDEEVLKHWGTHVSKKYTDKDTSKKVRKASEPFLKWLEEAEDDESDEE